MMNHSPKPLTKVLMLIICLMLMLTSCSLLPTNLTDVITGLNGSGDTVTISREEYERLKQYEELAELMDIVDQFYYQEPDHEAMIEGANMGLLYGLDDPYTFYYSPEDFAAMWEEDEGEYAGIGIQIMGNYTTGLCTVSRVFLDSPAMEVGILKGDILVKVEDIDVTATTLQDAVDIMRGEVGKPVNIQIMRGDQLLDFVVTRATVHVNWVNSCMLEGDVGYISLYEFSGDCSVAFEQHFNKLMEQGAKALIMDLRDNPGGWVDDSVKVADLFLDKGEVASLRYRDGSGETYTTEDGSNPIPLVVLVNENSASASEILSGALQDHDRATIMGVQTYGKGVVQYVLPVGSDGAGMQLTVAQYFTPDGHEVHHVGITPDIIVEMPEEQKSMFFEIGDLTDVQLNEAYKVALDMLK
ncbi:MAG: S41 family peptidase [Clostridia bacterium]|nr:S41 family peptidase [Clostridia bacterium]MBP3650939.1 S41 family peptidase [Clostridia bacterium]